MSSSHLIHALISSVIVLVSLLCVLYGILSYVNSAIITKLWNSYCTGCRRVCLSCCSNFNKD